VGGFLEVFRVFDRCLVVLGADGGRCSKNIFKSRQR